MNKSSILFIFRAELNPNLMGLYFQFRVLPQEGFVSLAKGHIFAFCVWIGPLQRVSYFSV